MNYTQFEGQDQELFSTALSYLRNGLSILPEKDRVPPFSGWSKEYRKRLPTQEEIKEWFSKYSGFGLLPGEISGNLEIIDIDLKNDPSGTIVDQYEERVSLQDPELFWKLTIEETPSGGLHLIYRCEEIGGKEDLAFSESGKPIIELLGENSKCTIFPTPGYSLLNRNYLDIPKITPEEREVLISVARSFNKKVKPHKVQVEYSSQKEYSTGLTPWEDYDQRGDALGLLFSHGWEEIGNQDETTYLKRPGKKKKENSGSWNSSKRLFYVWTHKSPFPSNKAFSPSAIFCFLECGGDFKEMARKLSEEGYGEKIEKTPKAPPPAPQIELENDLEPVEKENEINLDTSKINPIFKTYYSNFEGKNESPKEFILCPFLVALGTAIGKNARIPKGIDWHYPNIYMMIIGKSTWAGKSTGMRCGLKALKAINKERENRYIMEVERYNSLKPSDRDGVTPPFFDCFFYANDTNLPALLLKMKDKSDGLFSLGEMASFLAKMGSKHGDGLKEALTSMYDGEDYVKETASNGMVKVKNPRPSVLGLSTIEWLQEHIKHSDLLSGFLGRFVYVVRNEYEDIDVPQEKPITLDPAWNDLFMALSNSPEMTLRKSKEIDFLWDEYYIETKRNRIFPESLALHNPLGRVLREMIDKTMIINHMVDYYGGLVPESKRYEIQPKSYHEAIAWGEFFMENIKACYENLTTPKNYQEMRVFDLIRKHGDKDGGFITINHSKLLNKTRLLKQEFDPIMETLLQKKMVQTYSPCGTRGDYYKILAE